MQPFSLPNFSLPTFCLPIRVWGSLRRTAGATVLVLAAGAVHAVEPAVEPAVAAPVVETVHGPVQGLVVDGVAAYKGIRYGAPPVGAARFRPPRPPEPWAAVADATDYGAPAIQHYDRPLNGSTTSLQLARVFTTLSDAKIDNEDCLFLNVWTPAPGSGSRPVMVWLHGGGFAYGSGGWPVYDGTALARSGDVVVVTVNHRLNAFGYLDLSGLDGDGYASSGNAGMLDLVLALQWVRDNAARFGGDPANVTIMGESGGGAKVSTLLAMPAAAGLFHKAIIQSGPGLTAIPAATARANAAAVLAELGMAGEAVDNGGGVPRPVAERLAAVPPDAILAAVDRAAARQPGGLRLGPVVDGVVLPRDPFRPDAPPGARDIPVLVGWNKDEWTIFSTGAPWFGRMTAEELPAAAAQLAGARSTALLEAYRALEPGYSPTYLYNAILSDQRMLAGSVELAERKVEQGGAPVWVYWLTWETPVAGGIFRSPHTLDIPFMFRNVDRAVALTGDGPAQRRLEAMMADAWIAFARTGNPGHAGLPAWPPYDTTARPTLVFDDPPRIANDPRGTVRAIYAAP